MKLIDAYALIKWINKSRCADCPDKQDERCAACQWDDVIMSIETAPTIGGWISVKDRLPEETDCYLVHLINNYGIELDVYNVSDGGFHRDPGLVDYWMRIPPLPEPPEEVSGDV